MVLKLIRRQLQNLVGVETSTPVDIPQPTIAHKEHIKRELFQIPRYPPFDQGMPLVTVEQLLFSQEELIERIRMGFGISPKEFEDKVMRVIVNYARYVHLLPATREEHHAGAGGIFRLGLEVGFYAMQSAAGRVFSSKETAAMRRELQPRWLYATFIAGICSEIHLPLTSLIVVSDTGEQWPQYMMPLMEWCERGSLERYFIRWSDGVKGGHHRHAAAAYVLNHIIPQECLQYLNEDNQQIVTDMTASITGASRHGDGNVLATLVRTASDSVVEKDLAANPASYGRPTIGSQLEPHVVDVMRELVRSGEWKINIKQARIWVTREGVFLFWNAAFADIGKTMADRKISGFPKNQETLAEMMMKWGHIEANREGGAYWDVIIPGSGKLVSALKIVSPELLFGLDNVEVSDAVLMPGGNDQSEDQPAPKSDLHAAVATDKPPTAANNAEGKSTLEKPQQAASQSSTDKKKSAGNIEPPQQKAQETAQQQASEPAVSNGDELLSQVSEDSRRLLKAILDDYLAGESDYPVWVSAKGAVISVDEFNSHGIATLKVLEELRRKNWLYIDPENKNKLTVMAEKEKDGQRVNAYIITKMIATAIGFKD